MKYSHGPLEVKWKEDHGKKFMQGIYENLEFSSYSTVTTKATTWSKSFYLSIQTLFLLLFYFGFCWSFLAIERGFHIFYACFFGQHTNKLRIFKGLIIEMYSKLSLGLIFKRYAF